MKTNLLSQTFKITLLGLLLAGGTAAQTYTPPQPRQEPAGNVIMVRPAPGTEPVGLPGGPLPPTQPGAETVMVSPAAYGRDVESNDRVKELEANISAFDQSRAAAANAIFRLGESYQKLGQTEEAKVQYARILREFSDLPSLVEPSRRQLAGTGNISFSLNRAFIGTIGAGGPAQSVMAGDPFTAGPASGFPSGPDRKAVLTEEIRHLQGLVAFLQDRTDAEALPANVIEDPRYLRLKNDYEAALTSDSDSGRKEAIEMRRDRIREWMQKVYLPEQENALRFLSQQLQELEAAPGTGPAPEVGRPRGAASSGRFTPRIFGVGPGGGLPLAPAPEAPAAPSPQVR